MENKEIARQLLTNGHARHLYVDQKEGKLRIGNDEWKVGMVAFIGTVEGRMIYWNIKNMLQPEFAEFLWSEAVETLSLSFKGSNVEIEEAVATPLGADNNSVIDLAVYFEYDGCANVLCFQTGTGGFDIQLNFEECSARQVLLGIFDRFYKRIKERWEMKVRLR